MASQHEMLRARRRPAGSRWLPQAPPPPAEAGAGRGGRDPTPVSKRGGCSATAGLATCPRRKLVSLLGGTQADAFLADLDVADSARQRTSAAASWSADSRDQAPEVWLAGRWQRCQGRVRAWRPCGPIVSSSRPGSGGRGRAARGRHRGCPRPDRGGRPDQHGGSGTRACAGATLAASPPSSHPPASRTAGSGDGNDSSGNQRAESPDRPDKRDGNAYKDRAGGKDKPGKGKGKPGKGKRSSTPDGTVALSRNVPGKPQQRGGSPSWKEAKKGANHSTVSMICRL